MSHLDSLESLCQRTNLVNLDKDRVSCTHLDTLLEELNVSYEQVITNELATITDSRCQLNPVLPVVLIETILDRVDRILCDKVLEVSNLLISTKLLTIRILWHTILQLTIVIEPLTILAYSELRSSTVHSNLNILAWLIACVLDSLND